MTHPAVVGELVFEGLELAAKNPVGPLEHP